MHCQEMFGWRVGTTDEGEHLAYRNEDGAMVTLEKNNQGGCLMYEDFSGEVSVPTAVVRALLQLAGEM